MKTRLISAFALAGLLISSCATEELPVAGGSIAAEIDLELDTRTSVTDEGFFTWSAGDKVWIHTTSSGVTGTLSSGAGTASANFSYGTYFGEMTGKAVYPYNSGHSISGDVLTVNLPATYELGSVRDNTNALMYGVSQNNSFKFNHMAGVMRFNLKNVPAGANQFKITLDKKINGEFTADLTESHPSVSTEETSNDSEKTITLNFDALTQTTDLRLCFPLPVGTYNTLALELNSATTTIWSYINTVRNTVNRKGLVLMPTVNMGGSVSGDIENDGGSEGSQDGDYVDEYGINHGQGVEIDGVVWAPVNCGYHATDYKYGKLYQWGRKFGQGYDSSDASVPSIVSGPVSLSDGQSLSNSNNFYCVSSYPYVWYTPPYDALWNSGTFDDPVKTEYDPCPEGWRVPTYTELENLRSNTSSWTTNDNQNGYWFSGSTSYSESVPRVFFPAAGTRSYVDGSASSRGDLGYYWSSRMDGYDSFYLFISSRGVATSDYYHTLGLSVRCVQENDQNNNESSASVNLSSAGTANSYIVSQAGTYTISPVKGNSSESVGTVSSVEVLWESFGTDETPAVGSLISSVSYEDGRIKFSTPSTYREGNAVIAARNSSGTILWSWHIWLTDQPEGQVYYNNAGTMMDRNLGATSATPGDVGALGLLYQWGRKDPFLGSSSISSSVVATSTITWPSYVSSTSSTGTINYSVQHPTTFIACNDSNNDWYYTGSSSTDNTRWTTSGSAKSIYDPCPAGWRVPDGGSNGVWSKAAGSSSSISGYPYDSTNEGMNFSGTFGSSLTIWYPASSYRSGSNSSLNYVGISGYYWSASANGYGAYCLYFRSSGYVSPSNSLYRAPGRTVRCLQVID